MAAQSRQNSEPAYSGLGRTITPASEVVTPRRQGVRIYRFAANGDKAEFVSLVNAIYRQVMDIRSGDVPPEFRCLDLETKLEAREISVREFVRKLASSSAYQQRFCNSFPQNKVVEFIFRHILGRKPATQVEIHEYHEILTKSGLATAVDALINSQEYAQFFGEDVVPYQRIPSLPAGNYLGRVKAD
jgi:phycobilisome core-membrane linker protein